jgi:hypothetical protein
LHLARPSGIRPSTGGVHLAGVHASPLGWLSRIFRALTFLYMVVYMPDILTGNLYLSHDAIAFHQIQTKRSLNIPPTPCPNPNQHAHHLRKKTVILEYHEIRVATARVTPSRRHFLRPRYISGRRFLSRTTSTNIGRQWRMCCKLMAGMIIHCNWGSTQLNNRTAASWQTSARLS